MKLQKKDYGLLVLILLASFGAYFGLFTNNFTNWDDPYYISSEAIQRFDLVRMWSMTMVSNYFPITLMSIAADARMCFPEAWCFHISSLVIHLLNTVLLFLLFRRLLPTQKTVPFLATLVFAIHPLQVESVAWLSARNFPLSFLFLLATLHLYFSWQSRRQTLWWVLSFAVFILGLLSKSTVFVAPVILTIFHFADRKTLKNCLPLIPFYLLAIIAGAGSLHLYSESKAAYVPDSFFGLTQQLSLLFKALAFYPDKLLAPRNLSALYESSSLTFSWEHFLALGFILFLIGYGVVRGWLKDSKWWSLFLVSMVLLLPFLKLIPFNSVSDFNDRYMYYALGFMVAWLLYSLSKLLPPKAFPLVVVLVIALSAWGGVSTYNRVKVWQDPVTLWNDVLEKAPQSAAARFKLAELYYEMEEWKLSLEQTELGVRTPGPYTAVLYYLQAQSYLKLFEPAQARASLQKSLQAHPGFTLSSDLLKKISH